jgi:O-methyltransferase
MKQTITRVAKKAILACLPDSTRFRYLAYRPGFETWRKRHSGSHPVFDDRTEMYDFINQEILGNGTMQYLEFGVYKGESIAHFAQINSDPDSILVGFDTFTGLPEDWIGIRRTVERSAFDTGGQIPQLDDQRVSFVKGLFQDTLPRFREGYQARGQLVIHNDSDLYSSTLYVLTYLDDVIVPGTIIVFDEFYSALHEYRALEDYCASYVRSYDVIAATTDHKQIAIRMQ